MTLRIAFPAAAAALLSIAVTACTDGEAPATAQFPADPGSPTAAAWPQSPDAALQVDDAMLTAARPGEARAMPLPLDTRSMQPAQILDPDGGAHQVVAELEIPAGWTTVGGVSWNNGTSCVTNRFQMGWTAMGPDSLTAVELLPGFNWQVAGTQIQMNPCPTAPYRSTREFLEATVQRTRLGARVLDYQDQPELARRAAESSPPPQAGFNVRHDAGRMLIAYDKDGVDMREMLSATVTFSELQGNVVAGTSMISSSRAPNGRLDLELTERMGRTVRVNPQWAQQMQQRGLAAVQRIGNDQRASIDDWHNRQMAIINARGAADRHAIRMRTNQEVAGIYSAIAANTSATNDRIHARTIAGVNEVNNYTGVDGNRVTSSIHGGSQVFQNTNEPNQAFSTDAPYPDPPSGYVELQQEP